MDVTVRLTEQGEELLQEASVLLGLAPPHVLVRGLDLAHLLATHSREPGARVVLRAAGRPDQYLALRELGAPERGTSGESD